MRITAKGRQKSLAAFFIPCGFVFFCKEISYLRQVAYLANIHSVTML